jgi:hypothetical protein
MKEGQEQRDGRETLLAVDDDFWPSLSLMMIDPRK